MGKMSLQERLSHLHNLLAMALHDLVNVALSGQQVPEEAQCLHKDVDVCVGQEPEDLVCSKVEQDGHLEEGTK